MSGGSSGKTVTTIYQDGPDDSLIVKDGYEGNKPYAGTKTGTSYDQLRTSAIDAVEQLKQHSEDINTKTAEVNENIELEKEEDLPLDQNEGYKRMSGSDGSILGSLNNLSSAASSLFSINSSTSSISASGGKIKTSLSVGDLNSILNIVNKLSNGNYKGTVKDVGATTALISKTTTLASNNGINDSYQALAKNDQIDRNILVNSAINSISETTKVGNINTALDVSKAGLLSDVVSKDPSIINKIMSSSLLVSVSQEDKRNLFRSIFDSFKASGLRWNKVNISSGDVTSVGSTLVSEDMKKLMLSDIMSLHLTVYAGNDNTKNAAIDKQLSDPTLPDVLSIVYNNLSFEDKQLVVDVWNSEEQVEFIKSYKDKTDYYLGSLFDSKDLSLEISEKFTIPREILNFNIKR